MKTTTYINFSMDDIETPFDFEVKNIELEVTYTSYQKEDEIGIYGIDIDIEKVNAIKIDSVEPTEEQSGIILNLISGHEDDLKEMINDEIRIQQLSDKQAHAEWIYETKDF